MTIRYRRSTVAVILTMLFLHTTAAIADRLVMKNGDVITGNISQVADGEVLIEPAYADEFAVDLAEVVSIETDDTFEVELTDGTTLDAKFAVDPDGGQAVMVDDEIRRVDLVNLSEATEPEDWYDRTSHIDLNATWNDGNTDSKNTLLYADTSLKFGDHRHFADLTFRRDETEGDKTKEQDLFRYQYNWMFNDPWYTGANFSWERDPIRELDHRYTLGAVIGRDIFDDSNRFLTFSVGVGWSDEEIGGESESGTVGLWTLRYEHDFLGGDLTLFHDDSIQYQFYGVNNTILKSNTGFRFDIIADVYANVSLRYDWESDPAPGAEDFDTTLVVGVGAEF